MESFLINLISPLLSDPQSLKVENHGNSIVIKVADEDVGKVIGKHGSVIHSVRSLVKTYCAIHKLPFVSILLDSPALPPKTD